MSQLALWPASLAILAACVATTALALSAYLRAVHCWDAATAGFSAVPGAFSYVMAMAVRSQAVVARVAVSQLLRLLALALLLPLLPGGLDTAPVAALQIGAERRDPDLAPAAPAMIEPSPHQGGTERNILRGC